MILTLLYSVELGKIYNDTAFTLRSILKNTDKISSLSVPPPLLECLARKREIISSINQGLPQVSALSNSPFKVPGHYVIREDNDPNEKKVKLRFSDNLSVRFCISGKTNTFIDQTQPLIDRHNLAKTNNLTVFIMTCCIGIDSRYRELFYPAYWSRPILSDVLFNDGDL